MFCLGFLSGATRQEANTSPDENGNSPTNNGGSSYSGNLVTHSVISEARTQTNGSPRQVKLFDHYFFHTLN